MDMLDLITGILAIAAAIVSLLLPINRNQSGDGKSG